MHVAMSSALIVTVDLSKFTEICGVSYEFSSEHLGVFSPKGSYSGSSKTMFNYLRNCFLVVYCYLDVLNLHQDSSVHARMRCH